MVSLETRSKYISTIIDDIISKTTVRVKEVEVKGDRVTITMFQCPGKKVFKAVKRTANAKLKTDIHHDCDGTCEISFSMKEDDNE
jgi:hypothetical protein